MSQITTLLEKLVQGAVDLAEVEEDFSERVWVVPRSQARTVADVESDPNPYGDYPIEGSFEEVTEAYTSGRLTAEQYEVLSAAARHAMR